MTTPSFIVFEKEWPRDGTICCDANDVRLAIDGLSKRNIFDGYRVWAISLDDAPGRDVTADFWTERESDEDDCGSAYVSNGRSQSPLNYSARRGQL